MDLKFLIVMRKEFMNAVRERLRAVVPEVSHVDLWNHNVEYIEQEEGWCRPAVFVEIGAIEWTKFVGGGHRGKGVVHLHLVTDWCDGGYDAAFDLGMKVCGAIEGLRGEGFNGVELVETRTNHNHEDILEMVDSYGVRWLF